MKTYLFSLRAKPKNGAINVFKNIVIRTDKPIEDITDNLEEIFMFYLGVEVFSLEFNADVKEFFASSHEFYVQINYEEIEYMEI